METYALLGGGTIDLELPPNYSLAVAKSVLRYRGVDRDIAVLVGRTPGSIRWDADWTALFDGQYGGVAVTAQQRQDPPTIGLMWDLGGAVAATYIDGADDSVDSADVLLESVTLDLASGQPNMSVHSPVAISSRTGNGYGDELLFEHSNANDYPDIVVAPFGGRSGSGVKTSGGTVVAWAAGGGCRASVLVGSGGPESAASVARGVVATAKYAPRDG